jgi:hypothetical protein
LNFGLVKQHRAHQGATSTSEEGAEHSLECSIAEVRRREALMGTTLMRATFHSSGDDGERIPIPRLLIPAFEPAIKRSPPS